MGKNTQQVLCVGLRGSEEEKRASDLDLDLAGQVAAPDC